MSTPIAWPVRALSFVLYYLWQLIISNIIVGWDIVTPGTRIAAGITRLPLRCRTDLEITMLANLISLTPGTLTLSVSNRPPELYVHGMYAAEIDAFRESLYDMEERMLRGMRRSGEVGPVPDLPHHSTHPEGGA
ncbi:Na+/H+ antiporter subunit E [Hoyosella sp. G463]|uniref:Na+/H+ antiporter subunit E n=1 Tax=Lolliginicoccus lacisalsi TaxID=2742202 RepID=A0A927JEX8_9ACTN|nr:Na+/H+ antiporter subunit E [Lolliginicoccus lacisalsi]MBD8507207.1 Na+/H+ antiporter subunit E [Lolliginicoccus lacisalsi]